MGVSVAEVLSGLAETLRAAPYELRVLLFLSIMAPLVVAFIRAFWRWYLNERAIAKGIASLEYVKQMSGPEFETFCGEYFRCCGYSVRATPRSGDHGVDLILTAGGELVLVQCKRHKKPVGESVVRDLYGAVTHAGATSGIVCASEGFTKPARDWARGKPITFLSGEEVWTGLVRSR